MAAWKLLFLALKLRRGWNRIPPKQRRKLVEGARHRAQKQGPVVVRRVREQGPVVAKRVGTRLKDVRRKR
jgi:hypothetical protein